MLRRVVACAVLALALTAGAGVARAQGTVEPLRVLAQSAVVDPLTLEVHFTLVFDRPPDFTTVDALGRQADEFQYDVVGDPGLPYPASYDAIVRGGELHLSGGLLRIRDAVGPADPASGGWGPVRAAVPYRLTGAVVTFSAPLAAISDHSSDGRFSYLMQTARYGSLAQEIQGHSVVAAKRPVGVVVRPGHVNPRGNGIVTVAVLSDPGFAATAIDPATVAFGPAGARPIAGRAEARDVDGDGDADLVLRFRARQTGLACGDATATLTGRTLAGQVVTGAGAVTVVGCPRR